MGSLSDTCKGHRGWLLTSIPYQTDSPSHSVPFPWQLLLLQEWTHQWLKERTYISSLGGGFSLSFTGCFWQPSWDHEESHPKDKTPLQGGKPRRTMDRAWVLDDITELLKSTNFRACLPTSGSLLREVFLYFLFLFINGVICYL